VLLEWDPEMAAANLAKHGVDFHEAGTVLDDPLSTTFPDPTHSLATFRCKRPPLSPACRIQGVPQRRQIVDFWLDMAGLAGVDS
jgi:hypothetical protein